MLHADSEKSKQYRHLSLSEPRTVGFFVLCQVMPGAWKSHFTCLKALIKCIFAILALRATSKSPRLLRTLHGIVWRNFLRPHHGLAQQLYHKRLDSRYDTGLGSLGLRPFKAEQSASNQESRTDILHCPACRW